MNSFVRYIIAFSSREGVADDIPEIIFLAFHKKLVGTLKNL